MTLTNFKTLLLQEALKALGIDPGPLDGLWGARTDAAFVKSGKGKTWLIQSALIKRGIDPGPLDGAWGPLTEAALNKAFASETKLLATNVFAAKLVEIARGEVGVREVGNNSGARVREYQSATWLTPGPWAWCAAFVCWCFRQAASRVPLEIARPQTAGAWDFENWAIKEGVKLIKPAPGAIQAGDILVYEISHIGIASADSPSGRSDVETIEGNTDAGGGREGDGVYARVRSKKLVRAVIRIGAGDLKAS